MARQHSCFGMSVELEKMAKESTTVWRLARLEFNRTKIERDRCKNTQNYFSMLSLRARLKNAKNSACSAGQRSICKEKTSVYMFWIVYTCNLYPWIEEATMEILYVTSFTVIDCGHSILKLINTWSWSMKLSHGNQMKNSSFLHPSFLLLKSFCLRSTFKHSNSIQYRV